MNEIEIPIYFNPEDAESKIAIYGFMPLALCDIKLVTFNRIHEAIFDDIEEFKGEQTKYSQMYLCGNKFTSPYSSSKIFETLKHLK